MKNRVQVALFSYNFPHKKTQDFIYRLVSEGVNIGVIFAADPVKLNIKKSSVKTKINHGALIHPKIIAKNLSIKYVITKHDDHKLIKKMMGDIEIGVISGARIIKENIIKLFKKGIINFHPGIIPNARGLDSLLWSILNFEPLGVTAHLIDPKIDAGKILKSEKIPIFKNDSIFEISERLNELQVSMLVDAIFLTMENSYFKLNDYGSYNKKMDNDLELKAINNLNKYLEKYAE